MIRLLVLLAVFTTVVAIPDAPAHEVRPAYLELRATAPEIYDVFWKRPARGQAILPLDVVLPDNCTQTQPRLSLGDGSAQATRWSVRCEGGLAGRTVAVAGLDRTLVETIVQVVGVGGATQSARLMAGDNGFVVAGPSTWTGVAHVYLPLGVEHILFGFDHLCFVLALMLLIRDIRRLVSSITAFTIAHSITLAAATLGYVSVPPGPVETLIAFSIVLVAAEAVSLHRGHPAPGADRPWTIAFAFGLLHGLGFAGALSETGLPADAIPQALLFFNIGVEVGQLAFVGTLLVLGAVASRLSAATLPWASRASAYGIGSVAAFWTLDRLAGLI